ncbi:esterase [Gordonia araii NBRC 100433]|nr:esterase [Gordonia araii NBRC 100433]
MAGSADAAPRTVDRATGTIVTKTLTNAAGTRAYQVYTPKRHAPGRPLIAWVHGTSKVRNGDPMELRRTNTLLTEADRLGFSVVAPMQSLRADQAGMWHFFEPAGLTRGQGEISILADIVRKTAREQRADARRVFAVGHSAGGGAVHVLGAVYSDVFAAIAVSAGFPFVGDPSGSAVRTARDGRPVPTFLIHGDRDDTAVPVVGAAELSAARTANGIAGAAPRGAIVVPPSRDDKFPTRISRFGAGRSEIVRAEVLGAGHATGPGGVTLNGPALDRRVVAFLLSHRRP